MGISVNQNMTKKYSFTGKKVIKIHDQPWEHLSVSVEVEKVGPLSVVKMTLDLINVDYVIRKRNSSVTLRPKVSVEI